MRQSFQGDSPKPSPVYIPYILAFIGAFSGLACIQAVFGQAPYFIERGVPPLVASYVRLLRLLTMYVKKLRIMSS